MKRLLIATLLLAGCAANAQQLPPSVDMATLERAHPLYGTLAQYDRQIAALRATLGTTQFRIVDRDIAGAGAAVQHEASDAQNRVNGVLNGNAGVYAARRNAAMQTLLAQPAGNAPSGADVREHLQQAYDAESAQMRSGAQTDMETYASALETQERSAAAAFVNAMQAHVQRAYDARAQELRESESALLLNLARKHAPERLALRTKLQTLYLRPDRRAALQNRLQALQHAEDRQVAALRARDSVTLAAYLEQLRSQANRDISAMSTQLQARTAENLAARRRILAAQNQTPANLALNAPGGGNRGAPGDLRGALVQMKQSGPQPDAGSTKQAYAHASSDLSQRFAAIGQENDASVRAAKDQIARLERDRAELKQRMDDQITRFAREESARCNCANVTAAVRKDLQTLTS